MKKLLNKKRSHHRPLLKFDLKMKLSALFIFVTFFTLQANNSYSQKVKISLELNNVTVGELIDKIESSTEFRFVYKIKDVDLKRSITVNVKKESITTVLDEVLLNTDTTYRVYDKQIFLLKKEMTSVPQKATINSDVKNNIIQQWTVNGTISDSSGQPLPGASILEKNTTNGATTDFDGRFNLNVSSQNAVLVISYIGFVTEEIPVDGKTDITIQLKEDAAALDEIVVVGYGTQKRSDVTGAVVRADLESFQGSPNTNVAQSLQGTVPGLNIGQVNSAGATPSISIRGQVSIDGNQDVLIVLDGIQYNGSLSSINANDIESIDVLKDVSSTAVYGAQAANGVILITTKGGKRNQKAKVSIQSSYAMLDPTVNLRPMKRGEYIDYLNRQLYEFEFLAPDYTTPNPNYSGYFGSDNTGNPGTNINTNLGRPIDPNDPNSDLIFKDTDYDWWKEGTQTSFIQENLISVSGASEAISYLISLGFTEQEGIIKNDDYSRKSLRVNLDADATDWWKVGVQAFGSFENRDGDEPNLNDIGISSPLLEPYDENGDLIPSPSGTVFLNPFLGSNTQDYDRDDAFFVNIYSEIQLPLEGLSYRLNFGNNYRISKNYGSSIYGAGFIGDAGKNVGFYNDYTLDNILNYDRTFGKHDVNVTLLYGAIERKAEGTDAYSSSFDRLTLGYNDLATGANPRVSSYAWAEALNYQMARATYKYDNRYILTGTVRRDGFSGFAANNKTAYFPSGSVGWITSNESFMENVDWVNNLKLRVSYGVSGNQTSRYSSLARLTTRPAYVFGDGGSTAFGQELTSLENSDLAWEKTTGLNVGVDFSLFSNRLRGNVDVYRNITNDLLFSVRIPYLTGFSNIQTNVGEVKNAGVEISLSGDILRAGDFTWSATANYSANRNEVLALTGQDADGDGVEDDLVQSGLFIGKPLSTIFGYENGGIVQIGEQNVVGGFLPGEYKVVDQDGDGEITLDDRKFLGQRDPDFRASLLNTFKYKNLSLSVFFNAIQGGSGSYISNNDNSLYRDANTLLQNRISGIDWWSPQNPNGLNALSNSRPGIVPARFENRSFVRLQDVNLRYNFSESVLESLSLDALSIFISGKNLATWTNWKGWDPEYQNVRDNVYGVGLVTGGRPVLKGISLGINLTF